MFYAKQAARLLPVYQERANATPTWTWLSGGPFGPEGSVLATVAVLAAAVWTWRTRRFGPTGAPAAATDGEEH